MCGIAGIFAQSGVVGGQLAAMAKAIRHRGPDDEGYMLIDPLENTQYFRGVDTISEINAKHIDSETGDKKNIGGLAHRRLSIIDLSPAGHQPLAVDKDNYSIVFNGEIYNFMEIRETLRAKGYSFDSKSDSEVVLNAYREWGEKCVNEFVGMWAFAIWDKPVHKIFFSRDRFGVKPFYYVKKEGFFAFASEIKALFAIDLFQKNLIKTNLLQYLLWGRNTDPESTLFQDISELPPGCNGFYSPASDKLEKNIYYDLKNAVYQLREQYDRNDPVEKYRFLFERSIDFHLRSDVPVGSCLSGGLDSSAIVAIAANKMNGAGFNTFTAAYADPLIDELPFARLVSAKYPNLIPYTTYPSASNFWKDFNRMIWHQDLPIASSSIYAQWAVMKLAKEQGMKVLLDGQGADESLGGYAFFSGFHLLDLLKKFHFKRFIHESRQIKSNRSVNPGHEIKRALFHQLPDFVKKNQNKNRASFQFIELDFIKDMKTPPYPEEFGNSLTDRCLDSFRFGLHELLRYEDRNSMAFSIESRVPFLDHRLVEFSLALEDGWKLKDGWTKFILRKSIEDILPTEIAWRKDKKGFLTPQEAWKIELKPELENYLLQASGSGIFNLTHLKNFLTADCPDANSLSEFWKIVSIMKWFEVNFIQVAR